MSLSTHAAHFGARATQTLRPWNISKCETLTQSSRGMRRIRTCSTFTGSVSFVNPSTPAWFTVAIDRATYRPLRLRMTAAAHFMTHRYLEFNRPLAIEPPA